MTLLFIADIFCVHDETVIDSVRSLLFEEISSPAALLSALSSPQGVVDVSHLPLPLGWEQRRTRDGRVFFVDHNTKQTTFAGGRLAPQNPASFAPRIQHAYSP